MFVIIPIIIHSWISIFLGHADTICGELKVEYVYHSRSIDCKIHLTPSAFMATFITHDKFYRWIQTRHSTPTVILQKNAGSYNETKYGEDNYTLLIRNLDNSDEGRYQVHCWTNTKLNLFSTDVSVKIPTIVSTTVKAGLSNYSDGAGIGTTALVIVVLCAVMVVTFISVTVVLIKRNLRSNEHKEVDPLVNEDSISRRTQDYEGGHVYNEIDIDPMQLGCGSEDTKKSKSTNDNLGQSCASPVLPSIPNIKIKTQKPDNEYETVENTGSVKTNFGELDSEYEEVVTTTESDAVQTLKLILPEHTYVSTGEMNNKEDTIANSETDLEAKLDSKVDQENKVKIPIYAKVQKDIAKTNGDEGATQSKANTEYKVAFPTINCSEIAMSLGMEDIPHRGMASPKYGEPVMYSNLVYRNRQVKLRNSRTSKKSLQYAILDLAKPDTEFAEREKGSEDVRTVTQACQYASVDFEKKAFVAPIRKAPSSWYRSRNKKGNVK